MSTNKPKLQDKPFCARKGAGLAGFRFHDLRHTCGSWLAQAGVPQGHIAQVLGHSTLRMSERYSHLAPANAIAAVEKLEGGTQTGTHCSSGGRCFDATA